MKSRILRIIVNSPLHLENTLFFFSQQHCTHVLYLDVKSHGFREKYADMQPLVKYHWVLQIYPDRHRRFQCCIQVLMLTISYL